MRERRWESVHTLTFEDVLRLGARLRAQGLNAAAPEKEIICYIEEWMVEGPQDFSRLQSWPTEDVTFVQIHDEWQGDFFLLAGRYHTVYQRFRDVGTYCSLSHPWRIQETLHRHEPLAMLWLGFRHLHTFIRVRVQTSEVITPGETRGDELRGFWLEERRRAFDGAIKVLELPIETEITGRSVVLKTAEESVPFFCSWPDAFGPCQFEYNSCDQFEFLVPATRLAATSGAQPATVRGYLTGFTEPALKDFQEAGPRGKYAYRCSAHGTVAELPDMYEAIGPTGRLYATLCEFQTQTLLPQGTDAYAIIGIVAGDGGFRVEARLNRAPIPEDTVPAWLEQLLEMPVMYAPLPAFA